MTAARLPELLDARALSHLPITRIGRRVFVDRADVAEHLKRARRDAA